MGVPSLAPASAPILPIPNSVERFPPMQLRYACCKDSKETYRGAAKSRKYLGRVFCRWASSPQSHTGIVEPDHHRHGDHPTDRAHGDLWRDQQQGSRSRSHHHSDRHGSHAVYGHQLWPHGARLSQRRFSLHLCRAGDALRSGLRSRLGHGDGLPLEPAHLYGLLRKSRDEHCPWPILLCLDYHLCGILYLGESARHQDLCTVERSSVRGNGDRCPSLPWLCDPRALGHSPRSRIFYAPLLPA